MTTAHQTLRDALGMGHPARPIVIGRAVARELVDDHNAALARAAAGDHARTLLGAMHAALLDALGAVLADTASPDDWATAAHVHDRIAATYRPTKESAA